MMTLKLKLILTAALFLVAATLTYMMYQHIVATSTSSENLDARCEVMGRLCGMIIGSGMMLIWFMPFLRKLRKRFRKS